MRHSEHVLMAATGKEELMQCPNGHDNPQGAAFCNVCGQAIATPSTAPMATATPPQGPPSPSIASPTGPESSAPATKRNRVGMYTGIGLAVGVLVLASVFGVVALTGDSEGGKAADDRTLLQGALLLADTSGDSVEGSWDDCKGTGGYGDIGAGMALTVKDGDGNIVGSGNVESMTEETATALAESPVGGGADVDEAVSMLQTLEGSVCQLYFSARVDDAEYYSIALANRGAPLTYSREDLAKDDYWVFLTLGD